jgi:RHS repeat-associated protein
VSERHDFYPFGAEILTSAGGPRYQVAGYAPAVETAWLFTGKERDAETGLDYFGARYMSSAQGRWTSPDRINLTRSRLLNPANTLNKYIYGGNNPLKFIDRDGEDITIFYRPPSGSAFDFGHVFLGALNQETGRVGFLDYYPAGKTDGFGNGAGAFNTGNMQSRANEVAAGKYVSLTLQTTPEEAQKVIDQISRLLSGSAPGYSAASNNCTTTCEDVLRELGLNFGDVFPSTYWSDIYHRYSSDVQANQFKAFPFVAAPQKTGVEYGNPRNLGVNFNQLLFQIYLNQWSQQQQSSPPVKACVSASDGMGNSTGTSCDR